MTGTIIHDGFDVGQSGNVKPVMFYNKNNNIYYFKENKVGLT